MAAGTAAFALASAAVADDAIPLACGQPVVGTLDRDSGKERSYVLLPQAADSVVVVDAVDVSGTLDLLKLQVGRGTTCTGSAIVQARRNEDVEIEVSDCFGRDRGSFVITASVVSAGAGNCSEPLPCGTVPFVRRFATVGETHAYSFFARAGDEIDVWAGQGLPRAGEQRMRLRLFQPDGTPLTRGDSCGGRLSGRAPVTGQYTLLVSSCGKPENQPYWIAFDAPTCPAGPELTYLGLARADGRPFAPDEYDSEGRPIYRVSQGSGFFFVVEGRPGRSGAPVGLRAFVDDGWPDLQVLLSRPLGDGSPVLCDTRRPTVGGVPATPSLEFLDLEGVIRVVNDFGCRVDDGTGAPLGRDEADFACTSFPDGSDHFVSPRSTVQFCAVMSSAWAFRPGRTIVKVRLRDEAGNLGWPREMIVEVPGAPPAACGGDCNGDGTVTVDEIVAGVRAALGEAPVTQCPTMDQDGDGSVTIDEILLAVSHALSGCPPM
ncbi:MAG: hypothetical protein N3C12_01775 [Candidatus Binatia bacterium]|nr:hypothetical protein [Candidatus Binatia bacterium]